MDHLLSGDLIRALGFLKNEDIFDIENREPWFWSNED
jgi:hypothetical protein